MGDVFYPSQAGAEVIAMDPEMKRLMDATLRGGGQSANTLRMGMALPQTVEAHASEKKFDEIARRNVEAMLKIPLIAERAGSIPFEQALRNYKANIHGLYNPQLGVMTINPLTNYPQSYVLGHETGHFLIDKLNFLPTLKKQQIDEEIFADYLGGYNRQKKEDPRLPSLAKELFLRGPTGKK